MDNCSDTEIEQLGLASRRNQDIRRFQVPMHDQVQVRMPDPIAWPTRNGSA